MLKSIFKQIFHYVNSFIFKWAVFPRFYVFPKYSLIKFIGLFNLFINLQFHYYNVSFTF